MSDNTENKQTTRNNSNVAVIVTFAIIIAVIASSSEATITCSRWTRMLTVAGHR